MTRRVQVWSADFGSNTYILDSPEGRLMLDFGLPLRAAQVEYVARRARPDALFLTHHHLDHTGAAARTARATGLPVLMHALDMPYVTGGARRPALPLPLFGERLANAPEPLPLGSVQTIQEGADLLGWRAVHLPGHTPGMTGLWHEQTGTLVAGDALQNSLGARRPPRIFNADQAEVGRSVRKLASLKPRVVYVGHGGPLTGQAVRALAERQRW